MVIPTISIVGRSKVGKTTLIEKLIPEIKRRGYSVATIKHTAHNFDIDKRGKDSWRHAQAGADTVFICSPGKIAMVKRTSKEIPLPKIIASFTQDEVDIILTEGYKSATWPKIEVVGKEREAALPGKDKSENLVAIVGDKSDKTISKCIPCFAPDETVKIVDFLEWNFIRPKERNVADNFFQ